MSASRQMHAVQTTSVTTLSDRTRVNVLQDLLKTQPPRITWSRCVTVRKKTTHDLTNIKYSNADCCSALQQGSKKQKEAESLYDILLYQKTKQ